MPALIVLIVIGFFAQLVDGALGMAYGATSSTLLLAYGLSPATASASVHLAELGTTAVSGISHWRFGNIDWRTVRRIGIPGAIGAFIGAVVLSSISAEVARPWMAGILLAIGTYILLRFTLFGPPTPRGRNYIRGRYLAPLGLGAGFVDATGGGGWGPVATPTILASGKYEPRKVIGSVDTSEFLVALAASVGFLISLGSQGIAFRYVGASVGGLILITNARTMFDTYGISGDVRNLVYAALGTAWVAALAIVVRRLRRDGLPLLQRRLAPEHA
jgi:hypothetical protein